MLTDDYRSEKHAELMIYLPPYLASLALLPNVIGDFGLTSALDFTALAVLIAGVFVVARYRAALEAADVTARAWHEERDAALSMRDRVAEDLVKERAMTAALRARPDLDAVVVLLQGQETLLRAHEQNAEQRTDRIVQAINGGISPDAPQR